MAINYLKDSVSKPEQLPDFIFLDLNMPVMDGWEFLDEYALIHPQLNKNIPLYVFSSSISPVDIEKAKNINCISEFIVKPVSSEKIALIIKEKY